MPRQVELADDLGPQQRHDVGADREAEAREHLLGDGGAAQHVPALEHQHLLAGASQVGRARRGRCGRRRSRSRRSSRAFRAEHYARMQRPEARRQSAPRLPSSGCAIIPADADRDPLPRRTSALCESMSWRDWAGYFAVSAYEAHSRPRVQRDPQRGRADRRLAAVQVPGLRAGRDAPRGPHRDPRRAEDGRGPGGLHPLVRRRRQGDRRRHGLPALADELYRWTAAEPSLRWIRENAQRPRGRGRGRRGPARRPRAPGSDEPRRS